MAGVLALVSVAAASPQSPPPPEPTGTSARPEGPWPPSAVLAADPDDVRVPDTAGQARQNALVCPEPPAGVQHYAPGAGKTVALTFDDGPGTSTAAMLGILADAGVAATFFNVGTNEQVRPSLVRAEATQGFLLGNHTWSHEDLTTLTEAGQASQIDRASAGQAQLVGSSPCFFRPPYGAYNAATLRVAQARDLATWNWSVDTEDWRAGGSATPEWVNRIVTRAQSTQTNPVVLLHNMPGGSPATVAALPAIIAYYRDREYTFVDLTGRAADRFVTGDWDGNGTVTPGVVRQNRWYLRNSNTAGPADVTFTYGRATDRVVTGDWDGNGTTTPGVVRGNTWYLRNTNSSGGAGRALDYGRSTDRVVTGDWNGDGITTPGVVRGNTWFLRRSNASDPAAVSFAYGSASDRVVAGDWDGNGTTTPGVVRGNTWYQRRSNTSDPADASFTYGADTDRLLTGDWDGNGTTTPGVLRGSTWYLRDANSSGVANRTFAFAP